MNLDLKSIRFKPTYGGSGILRICAAICLSIAFAEIGTAAENVTTAGNISAVKNVSMSKDVAASRTVPKGKTSTNTSITIAPPEYELAHAANSKFIVLEKEAQAEFKSGDIKGCRKKLQRARKAYKSMSLADHKKYADLLMLQGDCDYSEDKYNKAIEQYNLAYAELKGQGAANQELLAICLNDLGGSYFHEKDYKKAAAIYEELTTLTEAIDGQNSPRLLWTFLDLINVNKKLDRLGDIEVLRRRLLALISASVDKQTLEKGVRAEPAGSDEQRPIPLIIWRAKADVPRGIIIAVHGLGLHCSSFQKFAERLSERNFSVCSMDVRGFGSWQLAKGSEQIDLENSIQDISGLVNLTHLKFPELPIFVLGESMGGALALRYAAEYPDTISGVISSVPADRRYKEKREAFRVAINFLRHPNKEISVGDVLSRAATTDSVSTEALKDPLMRADLSPKELIKFQIFMSQTALKASQIKNCPVLMLQGMKDRLAKPGATIDLFNNLTTADRDLYLLGQCQHLIFEEVDTPDIVFNSVLLWMENRIQHRTDLLREVAAPSPSAAPLPSSSPAVPDNVKRDEP